MPVIRIEFTRHHRIYRVGEDHSFEEWPDEVRADDIAALVASGHLEHPAEAMPAPPRPRKGTTRVEEAISLALPSHSDASGADAGLAEPT